MGLKVGAVFRCTIAPSKGVFVFLILQATVPAHGYPQVTSLPDVLRENRDKVVESGISFGRPVSRQVSMRRLAVAWNDLIVRLRMNESRLSIQENAALDGLLQPIQAGLLGIGLIPQRQAEVQSAWLDAEQLLANTSSLRAILERKHKKNRDVRAFRKLWRDARVLDEEARPLALTVSALERQR